MPYYQYGGNLDGGMRVVDEKLSFTPQLPEQWNGFSFKVNFRNQILKINIGKNETTFSVDGNEPMTVLLNGEAIEVQNTIKS